MVLVLYGLMGQLGVCSARALALTFCDFMVLVMLGLVSQLGSARAQALTQTPSTGLRHPYFKRKVPESDAWRVALTFCDFIVLVLRGLVGQLGVCSACAQRVLSMRSGTDGQTLIPTDTQTRTDIQRHSTRAD